MKKLFGIMMLSIAALVLGGCGEVVEVPSAHIGKLVTKDGYAQGVIPTSKFRFPACWNYCDNLVLVDMSDVGEQEDMVIFMPKDKLNLSVQVRMTLSVDSTKAPALFTTIQPVNYDEDHPDLKDKPRVSIIPWDSVYKTYARQIVLTETREYLSQFSIAEVSSSLERMNADLNKRLSEQLRTKTPFLVRYVGLTKVDYPSIITDAQENAAKRREQIQQEEAQLQISKVTLERQLQEETLRRKIELTKAATEAEALRMQRAEITPQLIELRRVENQRLWTEKWNGDLPDSVVINDSNSMLLNLPTPMIKKGE